MCCSTSAIRAKLASWFLSLGTDALATCTSGRVVDMRSWAHKYYHRNSQTELSRYLLTAAIPLASNICLAYAHTDGGPASRTPYSRRAPLQLLIPNPKKHYDEAVFKAISASAGSSH